MSDKKGIMEHNLCTNCYNMVKSDIIVSIQRHKASKANQSNKKPIE